MDGRGGRSAVADYQGLRSPPPGRCRLSGETGRKNMPQTASRADRPGRSFQNVRSKTPGITQGPSLKHAFDLFFQENHGPDFTALATAYKTEVLGGCGFDAYAV